MGAPGAGSTVAGGRPAGMRYARAVPAVSSETRGGERRRPTGRRPRLVGAALLVAAAGALAADLAAGGRAVPAVESSPAARAVASAFVQANALAENLGAPAPAGLSPASASWVLRSVPLVHDRGGHLRLGRAEHRWIGPAGTALPLSPALARRLVAAQAAEVRARFAGPVAGQQLGALRDLVAGEERARPVPAAPGGVRVARWYTLQVRGAAAVADAVVTQWEQHDTVVGLPGRERVVAAVSTDAVEVRATLLRRGGAWRVVRWSTAPWQQPT